MRSSSRYCRLLLDDGKFLILREIGSLTVPLIDPEKTNRNGHIGQFERFAPIKLSIEEIVERSMKADRDRKRDMARVAEQIFEHKDFILVRYRLGAPSLWDDCEKIEGRRTMSIATDTDAPDCRAVFGMIDRESGDPLAIISALGGTEAPCISHIACATPKPPQHCILAMLQELDAPPSWRLGADLMLAREYDLWFDGSAGGWEVREPVHLVAQTMRRTCFATHPPLEEKTDVFMLPDADQPLETADADTAYWAKHHYQELAFEQLHKLPNGGETRRRFSSWMPDGDPRMVKVVKDYLAGHLAELEAERDALAAPTP